VSATDGVSRTLVGNTGGWVFYIFAKDKQTNITCTGVGKKWSQLRRKLRFYKNKENLTYVIIM